MKFTPVPLPTLSEMLPLFPCSAFTRSAPDALTIPLSKMVELARTQKAPRKPMMSAPYGNTPDEHAFIIQGNAKNVIFVFSKIVSETPVEKKYPVVTAVEYTSTDDTCIIKKVIVTTED